MKPWIYVFAALTFLTVPATRLSAQSIFATLTGVVSDRTGAVAPNASVKLLNEGSASARDAVTNTEGYYRNPVNPYADFLSVGVLVAILPWHGQGCLPCVYVGLLRLTDRFLNCVYCSPHYGFQKAHNEPKPEGGLFKGENADRSNL